MLSAGNIIKFPALFRYAKPELSVPLLYIEVLHFGYEKLIIHG